MQLQANNTDVDLECREVTKSFGHFAAVQEVSFSIPSGSFFSILGPSGCGKTTLLRMVAGFQSPDHGDILIKGKSVLNTPPNRRPVNMVFQHLALFPNMTVAENVAYGLKRRGVAKTDIKSRVEDMLSRVGLPDSGDKQISQLSGGQKQRIAIARCLVLNPDVLLLDEPLGALDLKLREQMKVELKHLQEKFGATFIYITHDQSEALVMSDQVAVMNAGRFEQVGAPQELYYEPASRFVAGFVGESNRWYGVIQERDEKGFNVQCETGLKMRIDRPGNDLQVSHPWGVGKKLEFYLRPESITVTLGDTAPATTNRYKGKVESVLFDGARSQMLVRLPDAIELLNVALPQTAEFRRVKKGDVVSVGWMSGQVRCYEV
ncbi:spermidine/putrescine ABC transporter ATP-binding protein [Hahella sp. CCB-MM4]|uniref:ABC transporter ATP-binding protein n=1 Tax=Hahella sp. (strain CCB-MM4) TaxID=1926491 RepID=UPI000B9B91A6|nr:ABC transporter ATP-binding protein [Hahella sp. CCB-MM4]OZG72292.1 spermidine/putrescine ABC transporter ATP-binding protein [Hahella sp. CCB-MM4]